MSFPRHFIALVISIILVTSLVAGCANNNDSKPESVAEIIEEEFDVVIVGGGGAGLAAAAAASQEGAKVVVVEKMSMLGGNTLRSGGVYNAVNPKLQEKQGIEDSIDKFFQQTYEGGDKKAKEELVRLMVENATTDLDWLESMGVEFEPEVHAALGAMWPRSHGTIGSAGSPFIDAFKNTAESNGAKIYTNTTAEELEVEDGRVVGVKAINDKGQKYLFKANKGVVLATGGFSANVDLRMKYNPNLGPELPNTNQPGSTGDGILMAEKVDANLIHMEFIQVNPFGDPEDGSLLGCLFPSVNDMIYVNKEGKRFVNEGERRDRITEAQINQPDSTMFIISDARSLPKDGVSLFGEDVEQLIEQGKLVIADTIEELAEKIEVPADNLKTTVEAFNQAVDTKHDKEFGRPANYLTQKLEQSPFVANKRMPSVHHTMGGLDIDTKARVLNKDGNPVPGLYAAGEVCGGIHGANRLGGNAITEIVVFGRIAGISAAKGE